MDYTSYIFSRRPEDVDCAVLIDADRPQRTISWQKYVSAVKSIAVGLHALGLHEQDVVGLLSNNDPYYYVLADGVIAAGAIFAGIAPSVKKVELESYITAAEVGWLFTSVEKLELVLVTAQSMGIDKSRVIVFDPPGRDPEPYSGPQTRLGSLLGADERKWQNINNRKDPRDLVAMRQYTSGTTGVTKAVDICHDILIERIKRLNDPDLSPLEYDKAALHYIAMWGVGGQMTHAKAILGKMPAYFTSSEDAPTILDRIQSFGITLIQLAVPMMDGFIDAIDAGIRSREALQSLQSVLVGGAPSRKDGVKAFAALFPSHVIMRSGYGSTEAASIATTPADAHWIPGFVGFLSHDVELKIIDPETLETLSSDTEGEICVRSPRVFRNYCNNQAATDSVFLRDAGGSWFRTGDRGYLDPNNGQLAITGRFKEIFKVQSQHVAPSEVEDELRKHHSIVDAGVMSKAARGNNEDEECVAYVVRREDSGLTAQEVVDFIASRMARHKAPTGGVVFCERIPRNDGGKVMRKNLAQVPALPGSAKYSDISIENGK